MTGSTSTPPPGKGNGNGPPRNRREFWRDTAERLIRAFAQGTLAGLGVGTATFDRGGLPWLDAFTIGFGCAVIALLMSLAGGQIGDKNSGSWRKLPAQKPDSGEDAG
jgi:hypothetical protein